MKTTDPVIVHQTQGGIAALRSLREVYVSAPESVVKLQKVKEHA